MVESAPSSASTTRIVTLLSGTATTWFPTKAEVWYFQANVSLPSGMVELGHFLIELANTWTGVAFELEAGAEKISIKGFGQYLKKG